MDLQFLYPLLLYDMLPAVLDIDALAEMRGEGREVSGDAAPRQVIDSVF